jgi:hypothetical protein
MWRLLAGLASGLPCWLLMMVLAVFPAGAGHGWMAPAIVSLPGIILIPLTGVLLAIPSSAGETVQSQRRITARVIMVILIALDIAIVAITAGQGLAFLEREPAASTCFVYAMPWAVMWGLWHVIVIKMAAART